jgi:hypothetical protein
MLLAYFGPETMMPVASILCAIGGVVIMFWHKVVQFGRKLIGFVRPDQSRKGIPVRSVAEASPPGQARVPENAEVTHESGS